MKLYEILIVLCLFLCPMLTFSQNELTTIFAGSSDFHKADIFKTTTKNLQVKDKDANHHIFIEQIGAGNQVNSGFNSNSTNLTFRQKGVYNSINLHLSAEDLDENIVQQGSYNQVFDFANSTHEKVSLNLIQEGDNLLFTRYGSNSIGNRIHFNMSGKNNSLIIKNFK